MALVGLGHGIRIPNATTGMLAVKPRLAGTAAGLDGSMLITFGALLSTIASFILKNESTEVQMFILMWVLSLCAMTVAIFAEINDETE